MSGNDFKLNNKRVLKVLPVNASISQNMPPARGQQLAFVVALRACAALIILWHHFALYPPLREWAAPLLGDLLDWFEHHARATQVFFVVGGYVMARTMSGREWGTRHVVEFVKERYYRLGLPYLGVIAIVIPVYAFARDWVPEHVLGTPVSLFQLLAHFFFLQDILGYEPLSAGLWFVCINFQLGLIYVACLWLRDRAGQRRRDFVGLIGWGLAVFSLFYVNLDAEWEAWALYFFPYFFLGIIVHRAQRAGWAQLEFWLFQLLIVGAMCYEWRWRLAIALGVGIVLFAAEKTGFGARWPQNRLVSWFGRISFSLFLIHFPVLVLVSTIWTRLGWTSPLEAVAGLVAAFLLSIVAAVFYHRWVETPAARLARKNRPIAQPAAWGRKRPEPVFES